jgi:WD40 repeat protein
LSNGTAVFELESNEVFSDNFENERPLKFSPFANLLMTTNDQSTSVYDTETWSIHVTNAVPMAITCAYSNDARWMATGHKESGLTLWDLGTGKTQKGPDLPFVPNYNNAGLDFSSDNEIIATVSGPPWNHKSKVEFWIVPTLKPLLNLTLEFDNVTTARFSPDGNQLLTADWNGSIRVFDIKGGPQPEDTRLVLLEENPLMKHKSVVFDLKFSPTDTNSFATVGAGIVKIWNLVSLKLVESFLGYFPSGETKNVDWSPDGKTVAAQGNSHRVNLFKFRPELSSIDELTLGRNAFPLGISFDSKTLVTVSSPQGVQFWNISTEELKPIPSVTFEDAVQDILPKSPSINVPSAISADLQTLAVGKLDGSLLIWDGATGKKKTNPSPHSGKSVLAIAFSPDSKIFATLGQDSKINLWNLPCQKSPANPKVFPLPFPITPDQSGVKIRYRVEFSADGKTLVVCHGGISGVLKGSAGVFNIDSQSWTELHMPNLQGLALSANGKMLATGHKPEGLKLWNIDTDPAEILIEECMRR